MTARAVELIDKQSRGEALTEAEAAERAEIDAAWEWIKAVRAGSNSMEADPPANYADDANWPV
jgi:glucose-6-phosphate 1-dehydrogenase